MIVFIGIQASGKTTFYKELLACHGLVHINLDTLRTRRKEAMAIEKCLENGFSYVVDNTNPQIADRQKYIPAAKSHDYEVIGIFFQSKVKDCIERNALRNNGVPLLAITGTSGKLQIPSYNEGFDQLFFARITDTGFEITNWKE